MYSPPTRRHSLRVVHRRGCISAVPFPMEVKPLEQKDVGDKLTMAETMINKDKKLSPGADIHMKKLGDANGKNAPLDTSTKGENTFVLVSLPAQWAHSIKTPASHYPQPCHPDHLAKTLTTPSPPPLMTQRPSGLHTTAQTPSPRICR